MTTNMEISIREETARKLRLDKNPTFFLLLKQAVEQFCEYDLLNATSALFTLLYDDNKHARNKVLTKLNFTLYTEDSFEYEYFFIEEESILPIAEELQFQYHAAHPHFLKVKDCPNCEKELEVLKIVLANHPILLYRAVDSVWNALNNAENAQNCIHLLLSETEKVQAKGLEKMSHNPKHQQLLLPYAKEIGLLLKAMHNAFKEGQRLVSATPEKHQPPVNASPEKQLVMATQEELNATPFAVLAKIRDKVPAEATPVADAKPASKVAPTTDATPAPKVAPADDVAPSSEHSCNKPVKCSLIKDYTVSPELSKFLDNKDALTFSIPGAAEFWEQMTKLRSIGIDLNLLVDYLQYVLAVLSAHENLETATDSLIKADKAYEEANAKFRKDDMDTLHKLFAAGKALEEAKFTYNAAYDSFVEHRDAFENAVAKS